MVNALPDRCSQGQCQLTVILDLLAAYTFGVLMGSLASKGMVSWDQELDPAQQKTALDPVVEIQAIQWKRQMQLQGTDKDASRELAVRLIPELAQTLRCALPVLSLRAVFGRAAGQTSRGDSGHLERISTTENAAYSL